MEYFHEVGLEKVVGSGFRLTVEFGDTEQMVTDLSRGSLDAVIATKQIDNVNIDYLKIDQEDFCLVAPVSLELSDDLLPLSGDDERLEHFLLNQPWISYSSELPIIRRYWYTVFGQRPDIEPVMIVANLLLIRRAVELGLGISILPRYICRDSLGDGRLRVPWEPDEEVCNDLWIATRKLDRNNSEIKQLVSAMRTRQARVWSQ